MGTLIHGGDDAAYSAATSETVRPRRLGPWPTDCTGREYTVLGRDPVVFEDPCLRGARGIHMDASG
jgi:hypothetical protein